MYVSDAKIQKTQVDAGLVADAGINEREIRTIKAGFEGTEQERVNAKIKEALTDIINQIAGVLPVGEVNNCAQQDEDSKRQALVDGMLRNVDDFNLLSGAGFTASLLDQIKQDDRFEGCFPTGSAAPTSSSAASVALEL